MALGTVSDHVSAAQSTAVLAVVTVAVSAWEWAPWMVYPVHPCAHVHVCGRADGRACMRVCACGCACLVHACLVRCVALRACGVALRACVHALCVACTPVGGWAEWLAVHAVSCCVMYCRAVT